MRYFLSSLLFSFIFMFSNAILATDYKLGPGDTISIIVYGEPDLSLSRVKIPPQGNISLPLLGEIRATNRTAHKLEKFIYKKLKKGYLKKPSVSISISEYRPFFVNGQVQHPGAFPYVDGLTVQKAISIAGGFTERASQSKITLILENDTQENQVKDFNRKIRPGDILLVGESLF